MQLRRPPSDRRRIPRTATTKCRTRHEDNAPTRRTLLDNFFLKKKGTASGPTCTCATYRKATRRGVNIQGGQVCFIGCLDRWSKDEAYRLEMSALSHTATDTENWVTICSPTIESQSQNITRKAEQILQFLQHLAKQNWRRYHCCGHD